MCNCSKCFLAKHFRRRLNFCYIKVFLTFMGGQQVVQRYQQQKKNLSFNCAADQDTNWHLFSAASTFMTGLVARHICTFSPLNISLQLMLLWHMHHEAAHKKRKVKLMIATQSINQRYPLNARHFFSPFFFSKRFNNST